MPHGDTIFHPFNDVSAAPGEADTTTTDIITRDVEVTTGMWSGNTGSLFSFFTSTTQLGKAGAKYFLDVYDKNPASDSTAEVQYSIAYGHAYGSGSPTLAQSDTSTRSTQAIYYQFKSLLLDDPETALFQFSGSTTSEDIYAISISRARYRNMVDPGNFVLSLSGSNGKFTFIDDSNATLGNTLESARSGNTFNIVSGSISSAGSTIYSTTASNGESYGTLYPLKGIMILNPSAIIDTVGFAAQTENTDTAADTVTNATGVPASPYTGSLTGTGTEQYNWIGLHRSIVLGADFQARSAEVISSQHFFIRLRNTDATISNNPTWIASDNTIQIEEFEYDPKTYITTVGLYNKQNELLAISKLSRPLEKSLTKEALIRVRLDY
jgi:hypothetical protein